MDRKATAKETVRIMEQGFYEYEGRQTDIAEALDRSIRKSRLITPEQGAKILTLYGKGGPSSWRGETENIPVVDAVLKFIRERREKIGVLNFASAKNPGGGFLGGAMAQEESIAASGGLYRTLTVHEEYYRNNRACLTMMYTDHAIYSPDVVFFRDGKFRLLETPVTASVLTMPAVNMGQVLLKGEDPEEAERMMKRRMELALALFADSGDRNLILGAYGCGVFRNDPKKIAAWWKELLDGGYGACFDRILFAVLDRSAKQSCIRPFLEITDAEGK